MLIFMETVTNYLDSGYPVDVIYLDFRKAFDKVPHKRLLMKLQAHRIDGESLRWIKGWLSGRRQRVVINGQYSSWIDVLSGFHRDQSWDHCCLSYLSTILMSC